MNSGTPTNVITAFFLDIARLPHDDRCRNEMRRSARAVTVTALLVAALVYFAPVSPAEPSHALEGFGVTPGGAGQPLCRVTTLAEEGAGSLRECLGAGQRTVVFDVAGDIVLRSDLVVRGAFITIDGTSAPPPGITLRGRGLQLRGTAGVHDVIVRGLRIRDAAGDGVQIAWGAYNIVLDHVSVDGSGDGNLDITHGAHDVTVQWSLLGRTRLGKNSLIKTMVTNAPAETNHISVHHTIFTGSATRNPRISHLTGGSTWATDVTADFRNNIVANWAGGLGTDVQCGGKANIVGNLYSSPASGSNDQIQAIIVRTDGEAECLLGGLAYVAGNVSVTPLAQDINSSMWVKSPVPEPFPVAAVTTTSACEAAIATAGGAGYRPLDTVDRELLSGLSLEPCGEVPLPDEAPTGDDGVPPPGEGPDGSTPPPAPGGGGSADPGSTPLSGTWPDVVVRSASAPSEATRQTPFSVSDLTANIGLANAGPFKIGVFMSPDATVNRRDVLIGDRVLESGLTAGAESAGATLARINRIGTWWLGVCADWRGAVGEADERNNCLVIGTIVVK